MLPTIRSFLKLYTTIGTKKLADFVMSSEQSGRVRKDNEGQTETSDEADENAFRTLLLCYKHKMRGLQWNSGSPLGGEMTTSSDVDFFVDKDMIHIHDTKVQRKYSEFFIRHINKFEQIITDLSQPNKTA
eukprot:TRINITY_DN1213_c0_g1_i2.p1 TRINITY_DN1213_c0_g1~~TRINITY_DN1213_c0_g1_i2.p1  ORF type:complete len:130 (-),score=51.24 TRINITY_DN1213_c0_g1_i2:79-468(-)